MLSSQPHQLVALIPTRKRPVLLERALKSVYAQPRSADRVVIVVDSQDPADTQEVAELLARFEAGGHRYELLSNRRTPGLSGALNSGLDHVVRSAADATRTWVAFLDDDDEWTPDHLSACERHLPDVVQVLAAPFGRIEGRGKVIFPPSGLTSDDFLVGNPGIQGSNLVARLDTLLQAGGFDESLVSCTDRDLCIRLADLGASYRATAAVTVLHHADMARDRLSTPGSAAKQQGLSAFWRKYHTRMSPSQKEAFEARARELFHCAITTQTTTTVNSACGPAPEGELALVIGVIVDAERVDSVRKLLDDLTRLLSEPELIGLDVLLLENGDSCDESAELKAVVDEASSKLRIYYISRSRQRADAPANGLSDGGSINGSRLSIASARTVLQTYLYSLARTKPGAVVWILDDDMRLDPLVDDGTTTRRQHLPLVPRLLRLKAEKVGVAIGAYTGAPPLPFASCMRVQLVDLLASVQWLANLRPDALLPVLSAQNRSLREGRRDYYYDLSRTETDRLETPFLVEPADPTETAAAALARLARTAPRIFAGEQIFRPLVAQQDEGWVESGGKRGGNTFIFDIEALRVPNLSPIIGGRATRRSDMVWVWAQGRLNRRVVSVPIATFHDRRDERCAPLDAAKLVDDIRGFAAYSALEDCDPDPTPGKAEKYVEERLAAYRLSFFRCRGVARALRRALEKGWLATPRAAEARSQLLNFCAEVERRCDPAAFERIERECREFDDAEFESFRAGLDGRIADHAAAIGDGSALERGLLEDRINAAQKVVCRVAGAPRSLRRLGHGAEGVVFTDGARVYKAFDYWKSRTAKSKRALLSTLATQLQDAQVLYPVIDFFQDGPDAVLVYRFEQSTSYSGGHGPGLVDLLVDCVRFRIVCNNIHPDNLRVVAGSKVRLIDYGSDIERWSEEGFVAMCRRAWLSWRWPHLPNLKELMRRSLREHDLPELDGFERFLLAVRLAAGLEEQPCPLLERARALRPARVLDYGCGRGHLVRTLEADGCDALGFDPDPECRSRWNGSGAFVTTREEALDKGPFDLVVCQRVLCVVEDQRAFETILADLRSAVATGGRVLVSVCHPNWTGATTPQATACESPAPGLDGTFVWSKVVRSSGALRHDVHRPEHLLARSIRLAGFHIAARFEDATVDLTRFEPACNVLVLELIPLGPRPPVSLMIRACAQEAHTLRWQVEHLIEQLDAPRPFAERIVVIDGRIGAFPRQHAAGDLQRVTEEAYALQRDGYIDRVVEAPSQLGRLESMNLRWFGGRSTATHAANGGPLAATIAGFEACTSRYVLVVDADVIIARREPDHDMVAEMLEPLLRDARGVSVSCGIARDADLPYKADADPGTDATFRTEVRACLLDRERLLSVLPLPNCVTTDSIHLPWHRSLDAAMRRDGLRSYRGGSRTMFYIHPPNERKQSVDEWFITCAKAEAGQVPEVQHGHVDWHGTLEEWLPACRFEPYVFVVLGKDVPPGRFARCVESMMRQTEPAWGVIVIDDGSRPSLAHQNAYTARRLGARLTYLRMRHRRGGLANLDLAVRYLCGDPSTVIVTLDADDALIGERVLERLKSCYDDGADATVGSMLRTDKPASYPVNFDNPRRHRGGNVWQHLRSFRAELYRAIPIEDLQLDGRFIDIAWDWAYMLPIIERARRPVHIPDPLYLYEPSGADKGSAASRREEVIGRIMAKPSRWSP